VAVLKTLLELERELSTGLRERVRRNKAKAA
jgi:hypothetical protein